MLSLLNVDGCWHQEKINSQNKCSNMNVDFQITIARLYQLSLIDKLKVLERVLFLDSSQYIEEIENVINEIAQNKPYSKQ